MIEIESLKIRAYDRSGELFHHLVESGLAGVVDVNAGWAERDESDPEAPYIPLVTINGISGKEYALRVLQHDSIDEEFNNATAEEFEKMMAILWDKEIDFSQQVRELGAEVTKIAALVKAGFLEQAIAELKSSDSDSNIKDVVATARRLACTAVAEWSNAVEAEKYAIRSVFGDIYSVNTAYNANQGKELASFQKHRRTQIAEDGHGWLPVFSQLGYQSFAIYLIAGREVAHLTLERDTKVATVEVGPRSVKICEGVPLAEAVAMAEEYTRGLKETLDKVNGRPLAVI